MAVLAVGVAGAAIGWGVTGTLLGAQIGWGLGLWLGASFAPKQKVVGQQISSLNVTGVGPGQTIPWIQGTRRTAGYLWAASKKRPISHTESSGGKGGGGGVESTTFTYDVDLIIGLTINQMAYMTRVWADGKLIWSNAEPESLATMAGLSPGDPGYDDFIARATSAIIASLGSDNWESITFYDGSLTQMPDPTYESICAAAGTGPAPALRGRSYVAIKSFHTDGSGRVPLLTFEVTSRKVGDNMSIIPFYTLPDDNHWTSVAGTVPQKVVPTDGGSKMWFALQPNYIGAFFQGASQIGLYNHITQAFDFIVDVPNVPGLIVSRDITSNGRCWIITENGNGLVSTGPVYIVNADGTVVDVGVPPGFLNSSGTFGVTALVEGVTSVGYDPENFVVVFFCRQRGAFGQALFWASMDPHAGGWPGGSLSSSGDKPETGFNNYFFNGANRIKDRVYFVTYSSGGTARGLCWVDVNSKAVTYVRTHATDFTPPALVGWDEFLYVQDYTNPSRVQKLDRDGNFVAEVDLGTTEIGTITDDVYGNLYVRTGAGAIRTVYRVIKSSMTIYPLSATLIDGSDDILGGFAYLGVGIFVVRSATGDFEDVRLLSSPNKLLGETLQDVVRRLFLRAGYTESQFDVSALGAITKLVRSFAIAGVEPTRNAIEQLMATHFWSMTVSDKLYCYPRGGATVVTIPYEELAGRLGGTGDIKPFSQVLGSDLEYPAQLTLTYPNVRNDYQADTQSSPIRLSKTKNVAATTIELGLIPSEGKGIIDTWQLDQLMSSTRASIAVRGKYAFLEPTDPILITDKDGSLYRHRVVRKTDTFPILTLETVADDASVLKDEGIATSSGEPSIDVALPANTIMVLLDIPIVRDADNSPGGYVATKGDGEPYPGSGVYISTDKIEYNRVQTITESAIIGTCTSILDDWTGPPVFDERIGFLVNVGDGELSSAPYDTVIENSAVNLAAVGVHGKWEMIQFRNATLISTNPNVYRVTGIARGLFGTEWAMTGHVASETFVQIQTIGVRRIPLTAAQLGVPYTYKGATLGRRLSSADPVEFTNLGVGLRPYSPSELTAAYDTATGDITFTVYRRTRLDARTISTLGDSIPLGEESELWRIDLYDDDTFTNFVASFSFAGPTGVYTSAQQTIDFGAPQTQLFAAAQMISAIVGDGYPLRKSL